MKSASNRAEVYFQRGQKFFSLNKFSEALTAFESALIMDEYPHETAFLKILTLYKLERFEEVLLAVQVLEQSNQINASVLSIKCDALNHLERYAEVLQSCEQCIQLEPDNYIGYKSLA